MQQDQDRQPTPDEPQEDAPATVESDSPTEAEAETSAPMTVEPGAPEATASEATEISMATEENPAEAAAESSSEPEAEPATVPNSEPTEEPVTPESSESPAVEEAASAETGPVAESKPSAPENASETAEATTEAGETTESEGPAPESAETATATTETAAEATTETAAEATTETAAEATTETAAEATTETAAEATTEGDAEAPGEPPADDTDDASDTALDTEAKNARALKRQENLKALQGLSERLERLMGAEQINLKKTERYLRDAALALKSPPGLPSKQAWPALKRRLEAAREALMPKIRELEELEEWKRWANVPKQEELAKRLEDLAESQDFPLITREFRSTMEEWKKVATAPREKSEELWERFKAAREALRERVDAHLAQQAEERKENLKKKIALCEQAEALQDSTDWRNSADTLKGLQAEWKNSGPVPRKHSEAIWKRFRGACDVFFERRKKDLDARRGEWEENLKKKIALCEKAEELQDSTEWDSSTSRFQALQAEWKGIGPVPRKHSNSIWKRFRGACDRFFDRRSRKDELPLEGNVEVREKLLADLEALLPKAEEKKPKAKKAKKAEDPESTEGSESSVPEALEAAEMSGETETAEVTAEKATVEEPTAEEATVEEATAEETTEEETPAEAPTGPPENLAEKVQEIRQAWRTAGGVPQSRFHDLANHFSQLSEAVMKAYPEALEGSDLDPKVITTQRLRLTERLEGLVEEARPKKDDDEESTSMQDLAAQLQQALAANTIRQGAAFTPVNWREISTKVEAVKRGWRELPGEAEKGVAERFQNALDELNTLRPKDR